MSWDFLSHTKTIHTITVISRAAPARNPTCVLCRRKEIVAHGKWFLGTAAKNFDTTCWTTASNISIYQYTRLPSSAKPNHMHLLYIYLFYQSPRWIFEQQLYRDRGYLAAIPNWKTITTNNIRTGSLWAPHKHAQSTIWGNMYVGIHRKHRDSAKTRCCYERFIVPGRKSDCSTETSKIMLWFEVKSILFLILPIDEVIWTKYNENGNILNVIIRASEIMKNKNSVI